MTAVIGDVSEVTAPVIVISCVFLSGPFYIDDNVVAYTDRLFDLAEDCTAILHWTCRLSTTEVTFEGVVTHPCDEGTTDCGVFDGIQFISHLSECSSFSSVSTRSKPISSFVAVARDAITSSSLAGAVITWRRRPTRARASQVGWKTCWLHGRGSCRRANGSV